MLVDWGIYLHSKKHTRIYDIYTIYSTRSTAIFKEIEEERRKGRQ